jgi:NTP pyrophosphatase (non-canonical NTP hydrolase)
MTLREFQEKIASVYGVRDAARGRAGTFLWFVEEVGELAEALREGDERGLSEEFADCLAWLVSLAGISGVDIESAATAKYGGGCPSCGAVPCGCPDPSRPVG